MSCSLRWFMLKVQLAHVSVCLLSVVIVILFYRAVVFMSMVDTGRVSRNETTLFGHRRSVVRHHWYNNCSSNSIYCRNNRSQVISYKPHNTDYISSRRITRVSLHNGSHVPLSKIETKGIGSVKHYSDTVRAVSLSRTVGRALFRSRKLVIWSSDHHPAPAYDARHLLEPLGVRFLQYDLSPYCSFFDLCAERNSLKVSYSLCSLCYCKINALMKITPSGHICMAVCYYYTTLCPKKVYHPSTNDNWPTVLSVTPLAQCVVCLSSVCL